MGALDPERMEFNLGHRHRIAEYVEANYAESGERFAAKITELYRDHPTREDFGKEALVREVLENEELMGFFRT